MEKAKGGVSGLVLAQRVGQIAKIQQRLVVRSVGLETYLLDVIIGECNSSKGVDVLIVAKVAEFGDEDLRNRIKAEGASSILARYLLGFRHT